jgi:hypothetical protein
MRTQEYEVAVVVLVAAKVEVEVEIVVQLLLVVFANSILIGGIIWIVDMEMVVALVQLVKDDPLKIGAKNESIMMQVEAQLDEVAHQVGGVLEIMVADLGIIVVVEVAVMNAQIDAADTIVTVVSVAEVQAIVQVEESHPPTVEVAVLLQEMKEEEDLEMGEMALKEDMIDRFESDGHDIRCRTQVINKVHHVLINPINIESMIVCICVGMKTEYQSLLQLQCSQFSDSTYTDI